MRFAALIPLTAAAVNLLIAGIVLSRSKQQTINRVYLLWGLSIAVWNIGTYFMFRVQTEREALLWARFIQFGVIALPISLFHLTLLTANLARPRLLQASYVAGGILACANFTPLFVAGVRHVGYAWYSTGGPAFWAFTLLYVILTSATCAILYRRTRAPASLARTRAKSLLWAAGILIVFGTNDLLPILEVYRYPFTAIPIFPLGSLAAIVFGLLVAYSVLQHQLLDVHIALGRVAAHLVRFAFLFAIGLGLQLLVTVLAWGRIDSFAFASSICVLMVSTFIASMLFPRLLGTSSEGFERRLLGDRFEYQDQLRNFVERMSWYNDLNQLLDDINDLFVRTFRIARYEIILRDEKRRFFEVVRAHPERSARQGADLKINSPIFRYFETQKTEYLSVTGHFFRAGESSLEKAAREQLKQLQADFCFPLRTEDEPFGILVLGNKLSGEPYTATDVVLLIALVKNMSLVVNQIRLKMQILQTEELDLLGRMSRGMAHDLNNLLTPISTLLQLSSEGVSQQSMEELLPVALRNAKAIRAYIKESLFFSEHMRPDLQLGRLDMLVAQAVEVARNSRNKPVQVVTDLPGEVLVEMDEVLVQRLIANLISNAIDASAAEGTIRVELLRLVKTEVGRDWLRIRIIDQGEGIRKEDLNRVFTPYFTTKNRGDEARGFGLGLAICRKIVNLHGGNLSVSSQIRKGTTVQVDLPSRQIKQVTPPVVV